ncbi:MAG: hypothetical protein RLZZ628_1492 [Bacteroidota bacterium]|jgi:hypothetical protein
MSHRAVGLTPEELPIVQSGLSQIPKDAYAYLAIHGVDAVFKIFEADIWKTITHKSLARWINDNPNTYKDKDIVLLSCGDTVSSQKLADALGALDKAAKIKIRKIIAWSGEVAIFENGYIRGIGKCKIYEAGKKSIELTVGVPKGKLGAIKTGNSVVMSGAYYSDDITNWSWKSSKAFGHSFLTHGKAELQSLSSRLVNDKTYPEQGHWLDNDRAATFLANLKDDINQIELGKYEDFGMPANLGEVLTLDKNNKVIRTPATSVRVVRGTEGSRSFIRTVFPIL